MQIKEVLILREAVNDLEQGKSFYEEKQPGIGDYFWDSLFSDLESLLIYGGIHSKKWGFHRMLSKRFPYAIYYEVNNLSAYVVAVLPMRRDPKWINSKLSKRS